MDLSYVRLTLFIRIFVFSLDPRFWDRLVRYLAGCVCCSSPTCFILVCRAIDHLFRSDYKMVCSLESRLWVCDVARSIYCVSASCWVRGKRSVGRTLPLYSSIHWTHLNLSHYGHRSEAACWETCSIGKKEEKQSQYILSHRALDLHLDQSVALGTFIS